MAKMEIQGLAEYAQMLNRFEGKSDGMIKAAVYEGADAVSYTHLDVYKRQTLY